MKDCILIGKPNSGKTMFTLNFADFLGAKSLEIVLKTPEGAVSCQRYRIDFAVRQLADAVPHKTRCVHSVTLDFPSGKSSKSVKLTDTCGITEGIHQNEDIRKGMAQTLQTLRNADMVLHIFDAAQVTKQGLHAITDLDKQVAQYAQYKGGYAILANKMDLSAAEQGLRCITSHFPESVVIPISGLYRRGFKEVKRYVARFV